MQNLAIIAEDNEEFTLLPVSEVNVFNENNFLSTLNNYLWATYSIGEDWLIHATNLNAWIETKKTMGRDVKWVLY